jgi:hypothetical protein
VLRRDHYRCRIGLEGICLGEATEVDHERAVALYGASYDPAHLRAACLPCNRALGGQVAALKYRIATAAAVIGPSRDW